MPILGMNDGSIWPPRVPPAPPFAPAPPPPTIWTTTDSKTVMTSAPPSGPTTDMLNERIRALEQEVRETHKYYREKEESTQGTLYNLGKSLGDLSQQLVDANERNQALEDQNEAVTEQLDEAREELIAVRKKLKTFQRREKGTGSGTPGAAPSIDIVYAPDANPAQLSARVRDTLKQGGYIKNQW